MSLCVFCLLSSLWPVSGSVSLSQSVAIWLQTNQPTNQPPSQLSGSEAGYRTRPQLHLFHAGWLHRKPAPIETFPANYSTGCSESQWPCTHRGTHRCTHRCTRSALTHPTKQLVVRNLPTPPWWVAIVPLAVQRLELM